MGKKTLVLGASEKPSRFSNKAIKHLKAENHDVVAIGLREGKVDDVMIHTGFIPFDDIHTVTLYLNPENQRKYYQYLISLKPKRIIFNPGTENPELEYLASEAGIETIEYCTLIMLSEGSF